MTYFRLIITLAHSLPRVRSQSLKEHHNVTTFIPMFVAIANYYYVVDIVAKHCIWFTMSDKNDYFLSPIIALPSGKTSSRDIHIEQKRPHNFREIS